MFGIDFPEFIVIAIIALILFGPEKLPEYSQKLGQFIYKWRRAFTNLQRQMYMPQDLGQLTSPSPYHEDLCPNCRRRVTSEFAFCPHCGENLRPEPTTAAPAAPPLTEPPKTTTPP
ncbi:MAG: twin-arginine translocase TatA/TatE family subunit [Desulfobacca sp.]|uniref:twin-arginine translocase TatA/TatE family subunit n=1 Tax=Desulfobacca sp. TaxID=2067990 RepID=UPI004049159C